MTKFVIIAVALVALSGCTTTIGKCPTGMTSVTIVNGELVYEKVMGRCRPMTSAFDASSASLHNNPLFLPGR